MAGNLMMRPVSWSFTTGTAALVPPPAPVTGTTYYVSPSTSSGTGTFANPYGLPDLLNTSTTPVSQGRALTILRPGDTLYFRGGTYTVSGSTNQNYWWNQLISPTVSGTSSAPITLSAYPGETSELRHERRGPAPLWHRCSQIELHPVLGLHHSTLFNLCGSAVTDEVADAVCLSGTGNEVAYCKIIGQTHSNITDNYQAIWLTDANNSWIHHNEIYGFTGCWPQ